MSYLEPRGGQTPSGGRASGQSGVPAPYVSGVPAEEPDPYAAYRRQENAQRAADTGPNWDAFAPGPAQPSEPAWSAPVAATSTSQAEWELTEAERRRGPGRRRAGRDGKPPANRAGRNLPAAIGVGVGLVLVVLASLFWKPAFVGVVALASCVGIWEMVRALRTTGAKPPLPPLLAGGVLMTGLAWYGSTDALELGLLVTVLAALLWRLADGVADLKRDVAAAALISVYVPFLLSFGVLLARPDDGLQRVFIALIAVVFSDTGGYAAGVFFGKHPMAPTISPKKSWEGFAGSVAAAAVGSSVLAYLLLDVPFYWGLLFGAVISVVAVIGDLAESMLKRDIGIKDMSNLLPGHGGLMDRLDSILFAVPTAFLLLSLIAPPG
ncbi:phosphatidate cytidylyltransferase [Actinoplanes sp. NPDC049118]|uniref:phosphatidate cytidylyltransferase n=1 Tax=Actinoplanes sp. NPDC049118 TaxID=3155769 RepID=UPI0033F079E0